MRSKDFKQLKESFKQAGLVIIDHKKIKHIERLNKILDNFTLEGIKLYKLPPEEIVIEHFNQVLDQLKPDNYKLTAKGAVTLIYNIIEDYNKGLKWDKT